MFIKKLFKSLTLKNNEKIIVFNDNILNISRFISLMEIRKKLTDKIKVVDYKIKKLENLGKDDFCDDKILDVNVLFHATNIQNLEVYEGVKQLAEIKNEVSFINVKINDELIRLISLFIIEELVDIKKLDLSGVQLSFDHLNVLFQSLKENSSIEILNLSDNPLTVYGIRLIYYWLSRNDTIHSLNLRDTKIGEEAASYLVSVIRNNIALKCLNIGSNNFGKGFKDICSELKNNKTLRKIDLQSTLSGDMIKSISDLILNNKIIEELNLSNNPITIEHLSKLAVAFQNNNSIRKLFLDKTAVRCRTENSDRELLGFLESLNKPGFKVLHIWCATTNDYGMNAISDIMSRTVSSFCGIRISGLIDSIGLDVLYTAIIKNKTLVEFGLEGIIKVSYFTKKDFCNILAKNTVLNTVDLSGLKIGNEGLEEVSKLRNVLIRNLIIRDSDIDDEGAPVLFQVLKNFRSLERLDISENKLSDTSMELIEKGMQKAISLKSINLSGNKITDIGCSILLGHKNFVNAVTLNLSDNFISSFGKSNIWKALNIDEDDLDMSEVVLTRKIFKTKFKKKELLQDHEKILESVELIKPEVAFLNSELKKKINLFKEKRKRRIEYVKLCDIENFSPQKKKNANKREKFVDIGENPFVSPSLKKMLTEKRNPKKKKKKLASQTMRRLKRMNRARKTEGDTPIFKSRRKQNSFILGKILSEGLQEK